MKSIGSRSFSQLQHLIKHIEHTCKEAFSIVRENGLSSRIEISIRPPHGDDMRNCGHYNDFFVHAYLSIHELCSGLDFNFDVKYLDPQIVQSKVLSLASEVMSFMKVRASLQFNKVYVNRRVTEWLQAHLSLMMITAGISPQYGVRFLNQWLRDSHRYDPFNQSPSLGSLHQNPSLHNDPFPVLPWDIVFRIKKTLQKLHFTKTGIEVLVDFINNCRPKCNPRLWYEKLLLRDKLLLSMNLLTSIIPKLSKLMSKSEKERKVRQKVSSQLKHYRLQTNGEDETDLEARDPWWLLLGSNIDDIGYLAHQNEYLPLPLDPICRAIYAISQMGIFSDHRRPTFAKLLCKHILECHGERILLPHEKNALKPFKEEDVPLKLLKSCIHEDNQTKFPMKVLEHLCNALSITIKRYNRRYEHYIRALCEKYQFPCEGANYIITAATLTMSTKSGQKRAMNDIINKVMKWDLVVKLHCTTTMTNKYHRNADNNIVTITSQMAVASKVAPVLTTTVQGKDGYSVVSKCLNIDPSMHANKIRESLHRSLSKMQVLQPLFLMSDGRYNTNFEGYDSLCQLQESKGFQVLMTGTISTIVPSMTFCPEIILPMVSLVYEVAIMFYNIPEKKSYLHIYHQSRSITYFFNGLDITPSVQCLILSLESNGDYLRRHLYLEDSFINTRPRYNELSQRLLIPAFRAGLFSGRKKIGKNMAIILPDFKKYKRRSIIEILFHLMQDMAHHHIQTIHSFEFTEFMQELSSCGRIFKGFSNSVHQNCKIFALPLESIIALLNNPPTDGLNHQTICPIFSLKFKMSIGVFERKENSKCTYFYAFNPRTQQVECQVVNEYCVLVDQGHFIYLYSSDTHIGYYKPSLGHQLRNRSYFHVFDTPYSHLHSECFKDTIRVFANAHGINILGEDDARGHRLQIHSRTAVIPTFITSTTPNSSSFMDILQINVKHHAQVLIFPYNTIRGKWDACIVHHPQQNQLDAQNLLCSILNNSNDRNMYNHQCMKGILPSESESGFYMILYMLIGYHSYSLDDFSTSLGKLQTEENLCQKLKQWMHQIVNDEREQTYIPRWLEQVFSVQNV